MTRWLLQRAGRLDHGAVSVALFSEAVSLMSGLLLIRYAARRSGGVVERVALTNVDAKLQPSFRASRALLGHLNRPG